MKEDIPSVEQQNLLVGSTGLIRYYKKIKFVLKEWMDMKEEYYCLTSLWMLGTYLHKQFSAYPYLFFWAMKGSGKSRIMNMIAQLIKNGMMVGIMTEATLFRGAKNHSFCIDENEKTNAKGKENLKLLLFSAYKKGLKVPRMRKVKTPDGEEQVEEFHEVYCPIAMANIWGIDNILADRSLTAIIEKSGDKTKTKLIENFDDDTEFQTIRGGMETLTENMGNNLNYFGDVISKWNSRVKQKAEKTKYDKLFEKIDKTDIDGRDLELFFPLFIIADICGEKILDEIIEFSGKVVKQKRQQDVEENIDVQIYEFVSLYPNTEFVGVSELLLKLRDKLEYGENQEGWLNNKFFGKALRRLNLVSAERHGRKREVKLDINKAKKQIQLFKFPEKITNSELDEVFKF